MHCRKIGTALVHVGPAWQSGLTCQKIAVPAASCQSSLSPGAASFGWMGKEL